MFAKKLAAPTHPHYVLITLCTMLLFMFVWQITGVLLTSLLAAVLTALPVLIVIGVDRLQSLVQNPEVLTNKAPIEEVCSEEAEPEESLATSKGASVRDSMEGKR